MHTIGAAKLLCIMTYMHDEFCHIYWSETRSFGYAPIFLWPGFSLRRAQPTVRPTQIRRLLPAACLCHPVTTSPALPWLSTRRLSPSSTESSGSPFVLRPVPPTLVNFTQNCYVYKSRHVLKLSEYQSDQSELQYYRSCVMKSVSWLTPVSGDQPVACPRSVKLVVGFVVHAFTKRTGTCRPHTGPYSLGCQVGAVLRVDEDLKELLYDPNRMPAAVVSPHP